MQAGEKSETLGHAALVLLGLLLAPLVLRVLLGFELTEAASLSDGRGMLGDLLAGALFFTALVAVSTFSRVLAALLVVPWVLLHHANYELVHALGSMLSLDDAHYLGSGTFLAGSAAAVSRPWLVAALLLTSCAACWIGLGGLGRRSVLGGGALSLLLLAGYGAWPWTDSLPLWRQSDFLPRELARLAVTGQGARADVSGDPAAAMLERMPELAANLEGEPRFPLPGIKRNVLLVILESVSGAHLESILHEHWGRGEGSMPALDALAREHLSFATFVNHQRRTNKGLYALLCGEPPNLMAGVPKMSSYSIDGRRRCLPEILREAGYSTTYLQAAPLVFMLKDQFMPRIGFEAVHGGEWFRDAYSRTSWGVDDRAFFEQSIGMIEKLEAGDRPWFLSLLTVGTHHPFVVPDSFQPDARDDFRRTIAYLDFALEAFIGRLEEIGILEDTLVIFTSDESRGHQSGRNHISKVLSENWGFLVALTPERSRGMVREPFAQMDVALSILDYVGLAERGPHLMGRSIFRSYEAPRHIFFANGNLRVAGALDPRGRIVLCLDDFAVCHVEEPVDGRYFGGDRRRIASDGPEPALLRDFAERSVRQRPRELERLEIELQTRRKEIVKGAIARLLHGGQFIDLAADEWVEVEIDVSVRPLRKPGAAAGEVVLVPILRSSQSLEPLHRDRIVLAPGERLRFVYLYAPGEAVTDVQSQLMARSPNGRPFELEFERARITVMRRGEPEAYGVHVKVLEIDRG